MKVNAFILSVMGLAIFSSCAGGSGSEQVTAKEYRTMQVESQNTFLHKTYPATIKGQEDIEIRPWVDGFIEEILHFCLMHSPNVFKNYTWTTS